MEYSVGLGLARPVPLLHVPVEHLDPPLLVALESLGRHLQETGRSIHPLLALGVLFYFATWFPDTHTRHPTVLDLLGRHTYLDHVGAVVVVLADDGEEELAPPLLLETLHAGLGVEESMVGQF